MLQHVSPYACQLSGPGLQSATTHHPTHVLLELSNVSPQSPTMPNYVTAKIELISKATPTFSPSSNPPEVRVTVTTISHSRYRMSYTPYSRGQHSLEIQINDKQIYGSPFAVTVYPHPAELDHPVSVVTDLSTPHSIAFNSCGEMVVSESLCHRISIFDVRRQRIRTFGSPGKSLESMKSPAGVAIDDMDNIYVSSEHQLQKFTSGGVLIKRTRASRRGAHEGEFDHPRGVTLHNDEVYVCDCYNHRIQVFDLDLNFIRSIGSHGSGRGEFDAPVDVKFDNFGNMYIADYYNKRVQVMNDVGYVVQILDGQGGGVLGRPSALHIVNKYVYVSDSSGHRIVVYDISGQFVTSFGRRGPKMGELNDPHCITSCADGYIYVCDHWNNRIQIF